MARELDDEERPLSTVRGDELDRVGGVYERPDEREELERGGGE